MGAEAMRAATVYRRLLKAVEKHIGKDGGKGYFRDFVSQEFRNNSNLSDQEAARRKLKLASDYTYLINSMHHHQIRNSEPGRKFSTLDINGFSNTVVTCCKCTHFYKNCDVSSLSLSVPAGTSHVIALVWG
ncbi:hypothetical protein LUZ61_013544 [Rhynchospora tenuis]|uniref:Complex 1 LYR protein domain-containing protein n=1 Tax=Rhynchospora tenuis TaxID=198213 RepID=A0AAD5Z067_9POAL|nr:hypothetical protein LUZ61_013544 [Rhynchospora tenuis]